MSIIEVKFRFKFLNEKRLVRQVKLRLRNGGKEWKLLMIIYDNKLYKFSIFGMKNKTGEILKAEICDKCYEHNNYAFHS